MRFGDSHNRKQSQTPAAIDRSARELRGVVAKVRFYKEDTGFAIVQLRTGEAVKGTIKSAAVGLDYHFTGRWRTDPRWGDTFHADDAMAIVPTTANGIADYLTAHAKWVGEATAHELVEAYGDATLEVLKTDPARVACEIPGITATRAADIQSDLLARADLERVEVDVRGIVGAAGVTSRQIRAILDRWGKEAAALVRADPYRLIEDIDGIGWATADRIGQEIGIEPAAPARIRAAIMHVLRSAENGGEAGGVRWNGGDTCVPRAALVAAVGALAVIDAAPVDDQITRLLGDAELAAYGIGGAGDEARVYRRQTFDAESAIASVTLSLLSPLSAAPAVCGSGNPLPCAETPPAGAADPLDPLACLDLIGRAREVTDAEIADDLARARASANVSARRNLRANAHAEGAATAKEKHENQEGDPCP